MYSPPTNGLSEFGEFGRETRTTPGTFPECCAGAEDSVTRVQPARASARTKSATALLFIAALEFGRQPREDLIVDRARRSREFLDAKLGDAAAHGARCAIGYVDHAGV